MSGKASKRARAAANKYARQHGILKQGLLEQKKNFSWRRRLLEKVFPFLVARSTRELEDKQARWWYQRVLKSLAKQAYAQGHDPVFQSYLRARQKLQKDHSKKIFQNYRKPKEG